MIIIGITGGIGHGKTTLAQAFARVEPKTINLESSTIVAEVIDAWHAQTTSFPDPHDLDKVNNWLKLLPGILSNTVHQNVDYYTLQFSINDISTQPELYEKLFIHLQILEKNPELLNERISSNNKEEYRAIFQWLGGYLVKKVDTGIWYKEVMRRAHQAEGQGMLLCTIGGLRFPSDADIVHDAGGHVLLIHRPLMNEQDIGDPTERERTRIKIDSTITNDSGITEIVICAQHILTDIKLGKLQTRYITSEMRLV